MRANFGTKEIRENDPLLRGWKNTDRPTRALSKTDHLIKRVGTELVQIVQKYYKAYCETPSPSTAKKYRVWRLRLHMRLNNNAEILNQINESQNLGLNDDAPGPLCWDMNFD